MKQIFSLLFLTMLLGACSPGSNVTLTPDPGAKPESPGEITGEVFSLGPNHTLVVNNNKEGIVVPRYVNGDLSISGYDDFSFGDLYSSRGNIWRYKCDKYFSKLEPAVRRIERLQGLGSYEKAEQLILETIPNFQGHFYFSQVILDLIFMKDQDAQLLVYAQRDSLPKLKSVRALNYFDLKNTAISKVHGPQSFTNILKPYHEILLPNSNMQAVTFCDLLMGNLKLKTEFEGQEINISIIDSGRGYQPKYEPPTRYPWEN